MPFTFIVISFYAVIPVGINNSNLVLLKNLHVEFII